MRVLITGQNGFIASNLPRALNKLGHDVISLSNIKLPHVLATGEHCIHRNNESLWENEMSWLGVNVVIHNAAMVGTDVVALNPEEATLSNVAGTYNICRAANKLKIPVLYIGTTVIYDTSKYQDTAIVETSDLAPTTLYGSLKLASEFIVKSHCRKWAIVRPLFCYGGIGDNNSLIAKGFYGALKNKTQIDMFLDKTKIKDYMRVEDFCDAVALVLDKGLWGQDWNVAAETPQTTGDVVSMMGSVSGMNYDNIVKWHPATDYLGNHRLSSQKFRDASGWSPKFTLYGGLEKSWSDIQSNLGASGYNPLQYLEDAKSRNIDLTQFFNR